MMIKKENEQFILEIQRLREGNADPLPQNDTIDFNSTFYRKKESDIAPVEFRGKTDDVKRIKRYYEESIKDLTETNKRISETYQRQRDELAKKSDEINRYLDHIRSLNEKVDLFHKEFVQTDLKTKFDKISSENKVLKGEIQNIGKLVEAMKEQNLAKVELLENQKQELINKLNSYNIEELKTENYSLSSKLNDALSQIEKFKASLDTTNQELMESKNLISSKQSESAGNEEIISTLQRQLSDKAKQLDKTKLELSLEITSLKTKIASFEKENAEISVKLFNASKAQTKAEETLREKQSELTEFEKNTKAKMEVLDNRLERQVIVSKDEIKELNSKVEQMKLVINESNSSKQLIIDENINLKAQILSLKKRLDDHISFKESVLVNTKKVLKFYEPIYTNLSCLSCLEFLQSPLMLICGHSICMNCFNQHSDPKSKDSIVFCEECKIETKNKELMESKVIEQFCDKFSSSKKCISDILTLATQFSQNPS